MVEEIKKGKHTGTNGVSKFHLCVLISDVSLREYKWQYPAATKLSF